MGQHHVTSSRYLNGRAEEGSEAIYFGLTPNEGYVNSAADRWMRSHQGINISIYDVPSIVAEALPEAPTVKNITAGTTAITTPRTLKQRRPAKQPPSSRTPKKRLFSPAPDAAPLAGVTPGATSAAPPTITGPADGVTPNLGLICLVPDAVEFATIAASPFTSPTYIGLSNEDVNCESFSASMPGEVVA
ncbi:unnamed protein product [Boreogadus saida]